jgi:hypothetical protein
MRDGSSISANVASLLGATIWLTAALPASLRAQTDYYNTDAGRPIQIEDAYATERYAFELQLAPVRLERSGGGVYNWGAEPEIAYGIFPRTHVELGFPLVFTDMGADQRRYGLAGIDISMLHNLNVETRTLPAFGIAAEVLAPVGGLASENTYASAKGIVTRTFSWARFHANARYTFGDAPDAGTDEEGAAEISRWLAGMAVDRTFPLRSMLLTGEVFAQQPIHEDEDLEWNAAAGVRYQLDPYFALDAGLGKRLTGDDQSWFVTFGLARAFAVRALMPGR